MMMISEWCKTQKKGEKGSLSHSGEWSGESIGGRKENVEEQGIPHDQLLKVSEVE
jgi:hypothetical protein